MWDNQYSKILESGTIGINHYYTYFVPVLAKLINQQTDKISQQPTNWENRNGPDLVQAFLKNNDCIYRRRLKYC
jgi:hypothetical protein